jgi:methionyl-tRNA formyltransferase
VTLGSVTPRVLFLGGNGEFSTTVLRVLCAASIRIAGVFSYGFAGFQPPAGTPFRVQPPRSAALARLAEEFGLPVLCSDDLTGRATLQRLGALQADIFLAVCFPRRLPEQFLRLAGKASLNIHPSMLPAYRGPAPVFWQFRNGERDLGVTLHALNEELDAGPVLAQRSLVLSDGLHHAEIGRQLGCVGAHLFEQALPRLAASRAIYTAQDAGAAHYHPLPQSEDFVLDLHWSARRAFNFMCATDHYCREYPVLAGGQTLLLERAVGFADSDREQEVEHGGDLLAIPFRRGTLYAKPARTSS